MARAPLRVCIDARLKGGGESGGVEQVIIGLASGLSEIAQSGEEYLFLMRPGQEEWLLPYLKGRCSILHVKTSAVQHNDPTPAHRRLSFLESVIELFPRAVRRNLEALRKVVELLRLREYKRQLRVPQSDGAIEEAGVDVMHQTLQAGFLTSVPCIYHPHDLQHRHLPQNFSRKEIAWRDLTYRALCEQAKLVAVSSSWVKQDIIRQFTIPQEKVKVIPLAPPTAAYPTPSKEDVAAAKRKFGIDGPFIIYPAQTWRHKNHIKLLRAVTLLADKGCMVQVVCTGKKNENHDLLAAEMRKLKLEKQVKFLGFVSPLDLQCCYELARAVVIPTKFEAASFPIWEAFAMGVPVACSNVTALPEQVGDAGLIFDPDNPAEIASAIERLWHDDALREQLVERGRVRLSQLSWVETARIFRAEYKRLANRHSNVSDEAAIARSSPC